MRAFQCGKPRAIKARGQNQMDTWGLFCLPQANPPLGFSGLLKSSDLMTVLHCPARKALCSLRAVKVDDQLIFHRKLSHGLFSFHNGEGTDVSQHFQVLCQCFSSFV